MRHASLPFHFYVNVQNSYLGEHMPAGSTPAIWHGIYCRESQRLMCHVILKSGAHWSGLPLAAISTTETFDPTNNEHVEPWGAMGECIEAWHAEYLEGCPIKAFKVGSTGRHSGIIIDWADGFSRYPAEHKPLSLLILDAGYFALVPNNHYEITDKHFTEEKYRDQLKYYKRGETVYWET